MTNKKIIWTLILIGLLALICVERGAWSNVAQWREDQSATIWLGYTQSPLDMPVGMVSSVTNTGPGSGPLFNPNGMPLLAVVLSRLPNLWAVSLVLGVVQGALVLWVAWLIAGSSPLFFLLSLPALASVVLGATSVEFWNQWMMTSLNLAFFGLWILYLRKPSAWKITLLVIPMLLAPALYLAGLVNAILFFGFTLAAVWKRPPRGAENGRARRRAWIAPGLAALALIVLALFLTWIPYARAAGRSLTGASLEIGDVKERVVHALQSGLEFPIWNVLQWEQNSEDTFFQSSPFILDGPATLLLRLSRMLLTAQSVLLLSALGIGVVAWNRRRRPYDSFLNEGRRFEGAVALSGLAFVVLAYMLSPLLGGPFWASGERMDQQVQFLPFLLFAWFLVPFAVRVPERVRRILMGLSVLIAASFSLISLANSAQIIQLHLTYRSGYLSAADVPLSDKQRAVDFIAHDWMSVSSTKQVEVSYDLGGTRWYYVPESGIPMETWYPAPLTMGRAFDFELLRVYGLRNSQEGVQLRPLLPTRYLVTYAFLAEPSIPGASLSHHRFGRLRVSVVQ